MFCRVHDFFFIVMTKNSATLYGITNTNKYWSPLSLYLCAWCILMFQIPRRDHSFWGRPFPWLRSTHPPENMDSKGKKIIVCDNGTVCVFLFCGKLCYRHIISKVTKPLKSAHPTLGGTIWKVDAQHKRWQYHTSTHPIKSKKTFYFQVDTPR